MLFQVLLTTCSQWAAQPCSRLSISTGNKLLIFSIFTCVPLCFLLQIQKPSHFKDYFESMTLFFYILLYSIYHIGCRRTRYCPICPKYKSITANYILIQNHVLHLTTSLFRILFFQNQLNLYTVYCYLTKPYFSIYSIHFEEGLKTNLNFTRKKFEQILQLWVVCLVQH